jgi:hypothetical protein
MLPNVPPSPTTPSPPAKVTFCPGESESPRGMEMVRLADVTRNIGHDQDRELVGRDGAVVIGVERPEVDVAFAGCRR